MIQSYGIEVMAGFIVGFDNGRVLFGRMQAGEAPLAWLIPIKPPTAWAACALGIGHPTGARPHPVGIDIEHLDFPKLSKLKRL
jgi:hypothetical protein